MIAALTDVVEEITSAGVLAMTIEVSVQRRGRRRCPICRRKRVLFSLSAFAADQPVGYGEAKCLECAGLRPR